MYNKPDYDKPGYDKQKDKIMNKANEVSDIFEDPDNKHDKPMAKNIDESVNAYEIGGNLSQGRQVPEQYRQPPQNSQYAQPLYYPVYAPKQKAPGKWFGIISMILAIFLVADALLMLILSIALVTYQSSSHYIYENSFESIVEIMPIVIIGLSVFYLAVTVLPFVFSIVAQKKGYKNGISQSGFILSIISFISLLIAIGVTLM